MYSIRDIVNLIGPGCTESWVRKWVRILGLGQKVGWAVILTDVDVNKLREKFFGSAN